MNEQRIRVCAEIQASEEGFGVLCLPALRGVARSGVFELGAQTALASRTGERFLRAWIVCGREAEANEEFALSWPAIGGSVRARRGPSTSTAPAVPRGLPWKTLGFKASGGVGFSFQP